MIEEWKAIPGYEGFYEVSNMGKVRSIDRVVERGGPYGRRFLSLKSKMLSLIPGDQGHMSVYLYGPEGGTKSMKYFAVHRLVLLAFRGPCPPGMQACHFPDPDPTNNCVDNLMWGTPKTNMQHREIHGHGARGSKSVRAKLTEADIPVIRKKLAKAEGVLGGLSAIAREYKVDAATIRDIRIRKTWWHVA